MADQVAWARATAASLLAPLGRRWAHTLGVVERARALADVVPPSELEVLMAAAYLHDIGYAPALQRTGFHPLDGACFLQEHDCDRLARLVAYHSGARIEAEERGLLEALGFLPEERSLIADALTFCDLTTAPDGSPTAAFARLSEIAVRYGDDHPTVRAIRRSHVALLEQTIRISRLKRTGATAGERGRGCVRARRVA